MKTLARFVAHPRVDQLIRKVRGWWKAILPRHTFLFTLLFASLSLTGCGTLLPPSVPDINLPTAELPGENKLRFVVMGDSGDATTTQAAVATAIQNVCNSLGGCHFGLLLGDNIYPGGAVNVTDSQFQDKFENPYMGVDFPFFLVLGNHDYGGRGAGYEFWKGQVEVDYTDHSTSGNWQMPAHHYRFKVGGGTATVDLFAIDTNSIFYRNPWAQRWWLRRALANSDAQWKIVYGHHTYISNGKHGDAGHYEEGWLPFPAPPIVNGRAVKDFFDEVILGNAHLYLAGHDHSRQWLNPVCGVNFIVSGSAAKTSDLLRNDRKIHQSNDGGGFVLIEVTDESSMLIQFYDQNGDMEFANTLASTTIPQVCS